jgi:hypothetical protein
MDSITVQDDPTAALRKFLCAEELKLDDTVERLRARYVESDRDKAILKLVKKLHRNACARRNPRLPRSTGNRKDGIGFAIISESGAGKSTTLERIIREYPAFEGFDVPGSGCPVLRIEAPSPCTLKQLAMAILELLGYSVERDLKENVAWRRARKLLELHGIFFLWIDEAANVIHQKSEHEIRKVADTFRGLMLSRKWPVQIILSGVPELEGLLDADRQLRRRLKYVGFENVSPEDDAEMVEAAIHEYAKAAKLKVRFDRDDMLVGRLCHAAVYQFGLIMEVIVDAIESCIEDGNETLSIKGFANGYTSRTLEPLNLNPFLVSAWNTLDCSAIRKKPQRSIDEVNGKPSKKPKRGRR